MPRPWYLANLTFFVMAQAATLGRRLAADDRKGKEFEEEEAAPAASCCCLLARCAEQQPGRIMRGEQAREKERQPGGRELTPVKRERELSVCARGARKEREKFFLQLDLDSTFSSLPPLSFSRSSPRAPALVERITRAPLASRPPCYYLNITSSPGIPPFVSTKEKKGLSSLALSN